MIGLLSFVSPLHLCNEVYVAQFLGGPHTLAQSIVYHTGWSTMTKYQPNVFYTGITTIYMLHQSEQIQYMLLCYFLATLFAHDTLKLLASNP